LSRSMVIPCIPEGLVCAIKALMKSYVERLVRSRGHFGPVTT
jgi:hypothetical protein